MWIAKEGLSAPVPAPWKQCENAKGEVYYVNGQTKKKTWDHPLDQHYKQLCAQEKRKRDIIRKTKSVIEPRIPAEPARPSPPIQQTNAIDSISEVVTEPPPPPPPAKLEEFKNPDSKLSADLPEVQPQTQPVPETKPDIRAFLEETKSPVDPVVIVDEPDREREEEEKEKLERARAQAAEEARERQRRIEEQEMAKALEIARAKKREEDQRAAEAEIQV